jgi:hypothetical protein
MAVSAGNRDDAHSAGEEPEDEEPEEDIGRNLILPMWDKAGC